MAVKRMAKKKALKARTPIGSNGKKKTGRTKRTT